MEGLVRSLNPQPSTLNQSLSVARALPVDADEVVAVGPLVLELALVGFVDAPPDPLRQLLVRRLDDEGAVLFAGVDDALQGIGVDPARLFVADEVQDVIAVLDP